MPKIDVLMNGHTLRSTQGVVGFCTMVLIEGEKRTLVDVGHVGRRNVLLAALDQRGLTPADIDATVVTHAHWDHAQNLDLFDHAPILLHSWERKYAQSPHSNDWATPRWTGAMIESHSNIQEIEDGFEIEPGVRLLHTPGHSPGSVSVLVDTDNGVGAITGDVLHYATVALTKRNPLIFWSEADARTSIERILAAADLVYPGHDRPFRVVPEDEIEYLQPMELELAGLAPDAPGLSWDRSDRDPWVMPGIEGQSISGVRR